MIRPLPTTISPRPGESLNGLIRRIADVNRVPVRYLTGGPTFIMRPPPRVLDRLATLTTLSVHRLEELALTGIPSLGKYESMELNRDRRQWCTYCEIDRRDWYLAVGFACTACHRLLTNGDTPQLKLAPETVVLHSEITAAALDRSTGISVLTQFQQAAVRTRLTTPEAIPAASADSAALIAAAKFDGRQTEPIPLHPPSTALAAVTAWRSLTASQSHALPPAAPDVVEQQQVWQLIHRLNQFKPQQTNLPPVAADRALVHYLQAHRLATRHGGPLLNELPEIKPSLSTTDRARLAGHAARIRLGLQR